MMNKSIECEHCGYQAEISAAEAHEPYHCPACGRISYRHLGGHEHGESLRIMPQSGAKYETQECPNCTRSIPADAVLCTECGYHIEKQKMAGNRPGIDRRVLIAGSISAVVVLLVGTIFFFMFHSLDRVSKQDAARELAGVAVTNAESIVDVSEPPATEAPPVVQAEYSETNYLAAVENRVAQWRNEFEIELDSRFPPYSSGQQVVLRRSTGLIHRGILKNMGPVFLEIEQDGVLMEIPVEELDRSTRLKCDPAYRKRYVDYRADRRREEIEALPQEQLMKSVPDRSK